MRRPGVNRPGCRWDHHHLGATGACSFRPRVAFWPQARKIHLPLGRFHARRRVFTAAPDAGRYCIQRAARLGAGCAVCIVHRQGVLCTATDFTLFFCLLSFALLRGGRFRGQALPHALGGFLPLHALESEFFRAFAGLHFFAFRARIAGSIGVSDLSGASIRATKYLGLRRHH